EPRARPARTGSSTPPRRPRTAWTAPAARPTGRAGRPPIDRAPSCADVEARQAEAWEAPSRAGSCPQSSPVGASNWRAHGVVPAPRRRARGSPQCPPGASPVKNLPSVHGGSTMKRTLMLAAAVTALTGLLGIWNTDARAQQEPIVIKFSHVVTPDTP